MTDLEALQEMCNIVQAGGAVLVAGKVHEDLPTIQQVSQRDGARLKVDTPVGHHGYGLFAAKVGGEMISFDGGGAMRRAGTFGWCPLVASPEALAAMGYNLEAVEAAISELIEGAATPS